MQDLIYIVILAIGISLVLNIFLKRIKVESIIGYIITGIALTFIFDLEGKNHTLDKIAEFGVAFLMFSIGLEFSINKLKSMKREVFVYGLAQVFITSSIFFILINTFLELSTQTAIILSASLALSSTAIVLKLLNESQDIYKRYGQNSLGILLFQDIAVIPILLMVSIFASSQASLSSLLIDTSLSAIAVIILMFLGGRYLIPTIFKIIVDSKSDELFIVFALFLVITSAEFAHYFGFSYSLGAFIAGMIISESKYKYQIEADLIPFRDILLGVFFVAVGMQVNLTHIPENFGSILATLLIILVVKASVIFTILKINKFNKKISIKTAIILSQVGEFSFAVFELAKINNLFSGSETITQTVTIAIVISMILTPFVFRYLDKIGSLFENYHENILDNEQRDHVIVCGYGMLGQKVMKHLKELNIQAIAIEKNRKLIDIAKERNDIVTFGDASKKHILKHAHIKKAKAIIVAIDNAEKIKVLVKMLKNDYKDVDTFVKVSSNKDVEHLKDAGMKYIVNDIEHTSKTLINFMLNKDGDKLI